MYRLIYIYMTFKKKMPTFSNEKEDIENKIDKKESNEKTSNEINEEEKDNNIEQSKNELDEKQLMINELKKKNDDLERKLLYLAAEYENSKKRNKIEIESANKFAITKFAIDAVNIYDILQTALQNTDAEKTDNTLIDGIKMTISEFNKMFERIEINKIEPEINTPFDYNKHEAISRVQSKFEIGNIVKVVRPGYELYGRLLRPAMVIVSSGE